MNSIASKINEISLQVSADVMNRYASGLRGGDIIQPIEAALWQIINEAMSAENLLFLYLNNGRMHQFVDNIVFEKLEAYKEHTSLS